MTLKEAYEKAKDGDSLMREQEKEHWIEVGCPTTQIPLEDALADDWEVIPAKKEPVTAEESWSKFEDGARGSYVGNAAYYISGFKAGEENERLRHLQKIN